eukprot:CAMPEP_0117848014 /NCGR_PEP_ID=MMETSP0949-20121206/20145_1 /TAXON_ID=44440 /ORGANISM="Chattonella subsalsa, Strain CCMP2191" /LENGTH=639 /DNA_ID=CAMNT_0005694747 /DNA_START=251 /DNA_END=2169 /DNA_ORIENTATION=-
MFERGVAAGWPGSPLLNGHQPRRGFLTKLLHERDLRQLEGKANSMLNDGPLQLHFLQQLNRYHPEAVVERYEMGGFSRGEPHLREYCRALAALGRLNTEADIQRVIQDYSGPGGERVATSAIAAARSGLMGNSAASPKPVHVNVADSSWSAQLWRSARVLGVAFIVFSAIGASMDSRGLSSRLGMQNSSSPMPTASDKKFDDVVGVDEAKAELKELVMYLRDPGQFTRLGGKLPKGMLLTGPPGTGKTLLARAIAGEANVPFFYASGSEFEEMYVGVGARRVRDLFGAAKKSSPCIIFIDEIDAIGGSRQNKDHQSMKMTLNQLLVEMDGFKQNNGIIVVGATNYPDVLDTALTRPGRFDRHVNVPLPDVEGRRQILNLYAKKVTLDKAVDLKYLARGTPGMSGADLQNLVNQAALKASVEGAAAVGMPDLEFARDKILMGAERKSAIISPETARTTAYHEGGVGHALVALKTPGADPIHKATIMPRGPALGYVAFLPEGDQTSISRKQMLAKLDVGMGGRVAEEIIFGKENITSGAASDLKNATNIAKAMVTQYGMSREVGYVAHDLKNDSPESLAIIDREVKKLLCEAYERAKTVITTNRKGLDRLAKALLEYETLTKEEVEEVVRTGKIKGKIAKK